jgi:hypothetical protein
MFGAQEGVHLLTRLALGVFLASLAAPHTTARASPDASVEAGTDLDASAPQDGATPDAGPSSSCVARGDLHNSTPPALSNELWCVLKWAIAAWAVLGVARAGVEVLRNCGEQKNAPLAAQTDLLKELVRIGLAPQAAAAPDAARQALMQQIAAAAVRPLEALAAAPARSEALAKEVGTLSQKVAELTGTIEELKGRLAKQSLGSTTKGTGKV